ncbi:hypothetical protein V5735_09625 (plasmid) [Haladaptatus sp. SPP-AMP-3]|uniref:hypothetical protein n=1 Tax=Haladaptatus sp. SPP-AMP-3 TaxID=3121295 RepID=UPI003C2F58EA
MARELSVGVTLGAYLVVNLAHGVPHVAVPVPLTPFQSTFVVLIVTLAPVVGFVLLWRGAERIGSAVFATSMVASLVFGVYYHFIVSNPDNVHAVNGPWQSAFVTSAALVAIADAAGVAIGAWSWWTLGRDGRRETSESLRG